MNNSGKTVKNTAKRLLVLEALLVTLLAQTLFWLPLKYREPLVVEARTNDHIALLSGRSFKPEEFKRFRTWLDRHDPAAFSRSDAGHGYAAMLPENNAPDYSGIAPVRRQRTLAVPAAAGFAPVKSTAAAAGVILPPAQTAVHRRPSSSGVLILDHRGRELRKAPGNWVAHSSDTAGATVLTAAGGKGFRRLELVSSCGDRQLDIIAMRNLDPLRTSIRDGEWVTVYWNSGRRVRK